MLGVDALFASPAIPFPSTTTSSSSSSCSCRFSPAVAYAPRHPPGRRVLRRFDEVRACPDLGSRLPSKEAIGTWCNADAVCFDVDSTVCLDEGIHELADFCGVGRAVAEWTAKAMTGSVAFEEALAARLSLFKPSLDQVEDCIEKRPPRISPGIAELIKTLKAKNVDVYLVSGGFRQMIKFVAVIVSLKGLRLCIQHVGVTMGVPWTSRKWLLENIPSPMNELSVMAS